LEFTYEEECRINDFIEEQKRLSLFVPAGGRRWIYETPVTAANNLTTLRDLVTGNELKIGLAEIG
jgi:hypothetical protein